MYARIARISSKKPNAMENPRHGSEMYLPWRPESIRVLPVTKTKKTAITQAITASVSSQPVMICHAGRANR